MARLLHVAAVLLSVIVAAFVHADIQAICVFDPANGVGK